MNSNDRLNQSRDHLDGRLQGQCRRFLCGGGPQRARNDHRTSRRADTEVPVDGSHSIAHVIEHARGYRQWRSLGLTAATRNFLMSLDKGRGMRALRRLAQNLGLAYRYDGSWRPAGMRLPLETPPQPSAYSGVRALRRLAQILGLIYQDDGTWGLLRPRVPPAGQEAQPPASRDGPTS